MHIHGALRLSPNAPYKSPIVTTHSIEDEILADSS